MNHHPISQANKREQQTQQRRIQQVAGNPRWRFTNKTPQDRELRERRLYIQREQRHSEDKRCQLEPEDVKRQQQNTTAVVTLQTFYLGKHDLLTVYLGKLDFLSVTDFSPGNLPRENSIFWVLDMSRKQ